MISFRLIISFIIFLDVSTMISFGQDIQIQQMLGSVSDTNLISHVRALSTSGGHQSRVNFTAGNDSARSYIEKTFSALPNLSVELDTFFASVVQSPYEQRPLFNVVATLAGKQNLSDVVVVGAHYDSQAGRDSGWASNWKTMRAPGADDNASGVSAVLELARIFSGRSSGYFNNLPILFVTFAAEEGTTPPDTVYPSFLNGSDHLARKLQSEGVQVHGMINLDMIGYNPHYMYANIEADSQSVWLGEKSIQLNSLYSIDLILNGQPFPSHRWSDQWSFWNQKFPAILLIEHFNPTLADTFYTPNSNYHHWSDTLGSLNSSLMKSISQLALATVATIAMDSSSSTAVEKIPERGSMSASVSVFPNPFNSTTIMSIHLVSPSVISLRVYDILGREVENLIQNESKPTGRFQIAWNASKYSSGVYFARLVTEKGILYKKLLLLR